MSIKDPNGLKAAGRLFEKWRSSENEDLRAAACALEWIIARYGSRQGTIRGAV